MYNKETIYLYEDKLFLSKWEPSLRGYVQIEINNILPHLTSNCEIHNNVKLKHIFSFVEKNKDFWRPILTPYLDEFLEEIKLPLIPQDNKDEDPIEFFELYYFIKFDKKENELTGFNLPQFHGVGIASKDDPDSGRKKGERINYGIDFLKTNDYKEIPVKLDKSVLILTVPKDYSKKTSIKNYGNSDFTLISIIYGIFYELSFHGSPSSRNSALNSLKDRVEEIKNNPSDETG